MPGLTPTEIEEIYDEGYFTGGYDSEQDYVTAGDPRDLWRALLRALEGKVHGRQLLDIGCGLGYFVRAASELGWDAKGIELSAWAVEFARRELDADVTQGEIDAVEGTFDLITMWSYLEHISRPVAALRAARYRLATGGVLCVGVPNLRSLDVARCGGRARCFKREHLYYFTRGTLHRAMREAGFRETRPLVFWGGVDRGPLYVAAQFAARRVGVSTQLTSWARP